MRMHRGSSKDDRPNGRPSESLPLSAPRGLVRVTVEVDRAGAVVRRTLRVPAGSRIRDVVRLVGQSPEGCAVLIDGTPVPHDLTLDRATRLVVVPTFSGG